MYEEFAERNCFLLIIKRFQLLVGLMNPAYLLVFLLRSNLTRRKKMTGSIETCAVVVEGLKEFLF